MAYRTLLGLLFFLCSTFLQAQVGPGSNWYFGQNCGITFTTNPPTAISGGAMVTQEGCSTISDNLGNLLFYTDGSTVYSKNHSTMANGTGLNGNFSTAQSGVIVQQPGNPGIYYVFTMGASNIGNLCYSIVDMSLASGMGSVTVKNFTVFGPCLEKLTAVKHSNNNDIWVVVHETGTSTNFRTYILTSVGFNTTAVVSSVGGGASSQSVGYLKFSPDGTKLANAYYGAGICELYDFNRTSGTISNALQLTTSSSNYGVEFSPDGSKLYASSSSGRISQWSICAGSATAIASSIYTMNASSNWALQLAPDGKIYVARYQQSTLGVIHNPNTAGSGCNYVDQSFTVTSQCRLGLPNYVTSWFIPPPQQFTVTIGTPSNGIGCMTASFTAPPTGSLSLPGCSAFTTSLTNMLWNFGDSGSGSANTTTISNPLHQFSTLSTFTVSLILYYSNGGGTDTLKQVVNINQPCIAVSSTSITCANLGSATVTALGGIGPFSYTWMPSNQTGSVATGLSPGSYTITVYDLGNNYTYTATAIFNSLIPLTGNINYASSVTCNGAATGTAAYTNIAGGSGNHNYLWSNGLNSYTTSYVSTLSAGLWSATVTDALTGCVLNNLIFILQPPAQSLLLSAVSPTACVGFSASISGTNTGGTPYGSGPAYTYSWSSGPSSDTWTLSQNSAGVYVYTLTAFDSYSCAVSQTIQLDFIPNPTLTVANVSICPLQTATLSVSGASTYVWNTSATGSTFTDNPIATQQYTVVGSALGCSASAQASIILKPLPSPLINSNSPVCNGQSLTVSGSGGTAYVWSGPLSFTANIASAIIYNAAPNNSGVYQVTVTSANACTAATQATLTVNPTPTVSASGSNVCVNQNLNLSSNTPAGSTFVWNGPNGFSSTAQNPVLSNPPVSASGAYTVKVTSAVGCTNTAQAQVSVTALPIVMVSNDGPKCFGQALNLNGANTIGGTFYAWNGPNGFTSSVPNPLIANTSLAANGIYVLQVTQGPCVTTNSTSVIVYALPTASITSNSPVCETKSLALSVNGNSLTSYLWMGPVGFSGYVQALGRDSSVLGYSGVYTVMVTDIHNCQNSFQHSVNIIQNPTLSAVGATVCIFDAAVLKASGASTYNWYNAGGVFSSMASPTINSATSVAPVVYTVMGTAANGCTATTRATLNTLALPIPSLSVEPANRLCLNSAITLNGFGGMYYSWQGPANSLFAGKTVSFNVSSLALSGTYTLLVIDANNCRAKTTTTLQVDNLPGGSLSATPLQACVPFSSEFVFTANTSNTAPLKHLSWSLNKIPLKVKDFFTYTFNQPGIYVFEGVLQDSNTCASTIRLSVNAFAKPVADFIFTPKKPIENFDEVNFYDKSLGESLKKFSWFIKTEGEKSIELSGKNPSYIFSKAGMYPVALMVETDKSCKDSVVKQIRVEEDFGVYVPNAFTPNNDGLNEMFIPVFRGMYSFNLMIFDRWGLKVFESKDLSSGWDGTYNGHLCKQDVYTYKLTVIAENGKPKELTGKVTLYR